MNKPVLPRRRPVARPSLVRVAGLGALLLGAACLGAGAAGACGGKVTFVTGGAGGEGGAPPENECFLGHCGDPCLKCIGDACNNGKCDTKGICQPADVTFTCPPPPPG